MKRAAIAGAALMMLMAASVCRAQMSDDMKQRMAEMNRRAATQPAKPTTRPAKPSPVGAAPVVLKLVRLEAKPGAPDWVVAWVAAMPDRRLARIKASASAITDAEQSVTNAERRVDEISSVR